VVELSPPDNNNDNVNIDNRVWDSPFTRPAVTMLDIFYQGPVLALILLKCT